MKYEEILKNLSDCREFVTLGGRSKFKAQNMGGNLIIMISSGKSYAISKDLYDAVLRRYVQLKISQRYTSSKYTDPEWSECPARIQSPYLPAIWKSLEIQI